MFRNLFIFVVIALLAACTTQGDGATDGAVDTDASMAQQSRGATGTASAACEESFAPLAEMEISETSDLGDVPDEVQPTVEACESVADWIAGAQSALGIEVSAGGADFLLRTQCDDPAMTDSPICEELAAP